MVLWFALTARAGPAREIVLVAPAGPLKERVAAELEALGFSVRYESELAAGAVPAAPAQREQPPAARCTLALEPSDHVAHVSIFTAEHGQREEQFVIEPSAQVAGLAIRIAEFARAVLLASAQEQPALPDVSAGQQLAPAAPPSDWPALPPPHRSPVPVRPTASPPAAPKAALELGFAALGSPGGLGASYGLALAAGGFVARGLRLAVGAFASLSTQPHATREGSSQTRVNLIAADLRRDIRFRARFRPSFGGGLGAAVLSTQGRGSAPGYADARSRRITAGAYLRMGAGYHLMPSLALRLDATLGAQLSRFALTYANREAAHWGVPWFMGAFSVEFSL
jgi:hypothetical protein